METLILQRRYFKDATMGFLSIEGVDDPLWFTIERPWLDNQREISCIPVGSYEVHPYSSEKYPDVWEVQDVPNRDKILIHKGNWSHDVKGCIAVGQNAGYIEHEGVLKKAVGRSGKAIEEIKDRLGYPSAFYLEVR